jgi:hypothetical protein
MTRLANFSSNDTYNLLEGHKKRLLDYSMNKIVLYMNKHYYLQGCFKN